MRKITGLMLKAAFFAALLAGSASAKVYFISPDGSDANDGMTESGAFKTFGKAFGAMGGGDALVLLNGVYSEKAGTGYISYLGAGSGQPPSGLDSKRMTSVLARNPGKVTVDGGNDDGLYLGRIFRKDKFISVKGIEFKGGGTLRNNDQCQVRDCSFISSTREGGEVFRMASGGGQDNIIEDCRVQGKDGIVSVYILASGRGISEKEEERAGPKILQIFKFPETEPVPAPASSPAASEEKDEELKPARRNITYKEPTVEFGPKAAEVSIHDFNGDEVFRKAAQSGAAIVWDGRNRSGDLVGSGNYLCKIKGRSGKTVYHALVMIK